MFNAEFLTRRAFLKAGVTTLLAACGAQPPASQESLPVEENLPDGSSNDDVTPEPSPVGASEDEVPLAVKIGQMLMVGFRGLEAGRGDPIASDIQERYLGGVVLFDFDAPTRTFVRNVESPEQVAALVAGLQGLADLPLLVCIDQEGGIVSRLKPDYGFPETVSYQYLGELDDLDLTREQAGAIARTLAEVGVNLNLAPVVDLNTNPNNPIIGSLERSFSADPDVVTRHALVFIRAHHDVGVLCTLKHFPGHGSSTRDSHRGFVDVTGTWTREELEPYASIIAAGEADAVMTAHVFNSTLDPELPATLSKPTITGVLREELGFAGVVISDDMQMGAIRNNYGFEEAVRGALNAGVDIIAIANNSIYQEDAAARTHALITGWVDDGTVSAARIDQSYRRVQALKARLG